MGDGLQERDMKFEGPRLLSIDQEGRLLVERLGGRWGADGGMCRCPAHCDRMPSLSVRPGRSRLLFHCFAGCEPSAILRALKANRLLDPNSGVAGGSASRRSGDCNAAGLRLWGEARSIARTPAAAYLASRGLEIQSAELRYHPRTAHGRAPLTQYRPALIAAVRDDSGIVAVHRTFLDDQGRGLAAIASPRCGLGRFGQGAVRLGGAGPRLGLAEGIETALSATLLFEVPCWATLGSERFRRIALPAGTSELLLFLDHDAGGRRAERLAREAFAGTVQIEAHYPEGRGDDWNDVLLKKAGSRSDGKETTGD